MKCNTLIAATVCLLIVAGSLDADSITIKWTKTYFTVGNMNVWGGGVSNEVIGGGVVRFTVCDDPPPTGDGDNLVLELGTGYLNTFCIEIPQGVSEECTTYDVVDAEDGAVPGVPVGMMGSTKAGFLSELWGRYFGNAMSSPSLSEAFSAAVYEIVYEDNSTVWDTTSIGSPDGRGFMCTNADTATANLWLASLNGDGPMADLRALTHREHQDFIVEYREPTGDIPEPATILLLGSGILGGLAWVRRRRR